jgi:hypothetical protein
MKAKLNKVDNGYVLLVDNIMYATDNDKLSKQNCDEIFGIVDVDKLAEEWVFETNGHKWSNNDDTAGDNYGSYKCGFNKAMELSKDKVFTLEDVRKLLRLVHTLPNFELEQFEDENNVLQIDDFISHHLQQPTEIEVEIEMEKVPSAWMYTKLGELRPKLDSEGCLILKRVV